MVPILDLKVQYQALRAEVDAAIHGVLERAEFILGPEVKEFERRCGSLCACERGVGVASGTDAIRLALAALEIGPGDEVITSPFTFIGTASPISRSGATPVFVDIDPRTFNLDAALLPQALSPRTRAIIAVHLYGQPADMMPILDFARQHKLFVIEDAAQALGAVYRDQPVGSLGDMGCLSFFPTKNLGCYGDGGMIVTRNAALAEKVDVLRRQGSRQKYLADRVGYNSRLDTLQAAILNVKIKYLAAWNERRRQIAHRYGELLSGTAVVLPTEAPGCRHVFHQFTLRTPRRDALAAHLHAKGIGTMIYYPVPLHRQKVYEPLGYGPDSLPNSEKVAAEVLSLPMYPELTDVQISHVALTIKEFFS